MLTFTIVCCSVVILVFTVLPRITAFIVKSLLSFLLSRFIYSIEVKSIKFYPCLQIDDFAINVKPSKKFPQVLIVWKHFKLVIRYSRFFRSNYIGVKQNDRLIEFQFEDFHVECIGLRFKDIIGPSATAKYPKTDDYKNVSLESCELISEEYVGMKYLDRLRLGLGKRPIRVVFKLMQVIASLIKVQFNSNFDFDFAMTSIKAKIIGSGSNVSMYFLLTESTTSDGIVAAMDIREGHLEVYKNDVLAVNYFNELAQIRVDYHLPSGMQHAKLSIFGTDDVHIKLPQLLEFYHEYQHAEDDGIEVKLSRGQITSGKMYNIEIHQKKMKISLTDPRCQGILVMEIEDMAMQMLFYAKTNLNRRYIRGLHRLIAPGKDRIYNPSEVLTAHMEKVMIMNASNVKWRGFNNPTHVSNPSSAYIRNARFHKTLQVNNDGDFVDTELIHGSVDEAEFQRVSFAFLEWLITLQEVSNSLPTSRFAHLKKSTMIGVNNSMIFSTSTSDATPLSSPGSHSEDSDELVVFMTKNVEVKRTALPRQTDSIIESKADVVRVHSSLLAFGMTSRYNVHTINRELKRPTGDLENSSDTTSRIGMLWTMKHIHGKMTLGIRSKFQYITIDDGLSVKFTSESAKRKVYSMKKVKQRNSIESQPSQADSAGQSNHPTPTTNSNPSESVSSNTSGKYVDDSNRHQKTIPDIGPLPSPTKQSTRNRRKNTSSRFVYVTEKKLNPADSCTILSEFMKTSLFQTSWNGIDMTAKLGDVDVNMSMGAMIKFMTSFNMIRGVVNRVLGHMSRIKQISNAKYVVPPIEIQDPFNTSLINNLRMRFAIGTTKPSPNTSAEEFAKLPLFMDVTMNDVMIGQSTTKQVYKWSKAIYYFNDWIDRPAFIHEEFEYTTIIIDPKSQSNGTKKPHVSKPDKKTKNSNDSKILTVPIKHQTLKMKEFYIGLSTLNHFGETFEAIMTQYDVYKIASMSSSPSIRLNDHDSNIPNPLQFKSALEKIRTDPFVLDVEYGLWILNMDGPYDGNYVRNMTEFRYDNFILHLDSTQKEIDTYTTIANLDYGLDRESSDKSADMLTYECVMHSNAFGGDMIMKFDIFSMKFSSLDKPFVKMRNVAITGPMYSCSIDDPRVQVNVLTIPLEDAHIHVPASKSSPRAKSGKNKLIPSSYDIDSTMFVHLRKSTAPSKFYFSLQVNCDDCLVNYESLTSSCMDAYNYGMKWYQPPNHDQSPPLVWWDSWRYWFHGTYSLNIKKFQFINHLQSHLGHLKMLFTFIDYNFLIDNTNYELCAKSFEMDIEITDSSSYNRKLKAYHKLDRKQSSYLLNCNQKIVRMPGFIFSLTHRRSDNNNHKNESKFYTHHDVYLQPCHIEYPHDKYALFRQKRMSVHWTIEMLCLDEPQKPIMIFSKLDTISIVLDALKQTKQSLDKSYSETSTPSSPIGVSVTPTTTYSTSDHNNSNTIDVSRTQLNPDISGEAVLESNEDDIENLVQAARIVKQSHEIKTMNQNAPTLGLTDLIHTCECQIGIHSLVLTSWMSSSSLKGIVFSWKQLETQLRFTNKLESSHILNHHESSQNSSVGTESLNINTSQNHSNENESSSVSPQSSYEIDHMFVELHFVELYVREWISEQQNVESDDTALHSPSSSARRELNEIESLRGRGMHRLFATTVTNIVTASKEPMTISEIRRLMQPIYKLAHATKVEISISENGSICEKKLSFRTIGVDDSSFNHSNYYCNSRLSPQKSPNASTITSTVNDNDDKQLTITTLVLETSAGRIEFLIGKQLRKKLQVSKRSQTIKQFPLIESYRSARLIYIIQGKNQQSTNILTPNQPSRIKSNVIKGLKKNDDKKFINQPSPSTKSGFRPILTSFVTNHEALMPPSFSLPSSYHGARTLPTPQLTRTHSMKTLPISDFLVSNQKHHEIPDTSLHSKIVGLRMIDTRLLWTIEMRDILFHYVSSYFDYISPEVETHEASRELINTQSSSSNPDLTSNSNKDSTKDSNKEQINTNMNATINDFLQVEINNDTQRLPTSLKSNNHTYKKHYQSDLQKEFSEGHGRYTKRDESESILKKPDDLQPESVLSKKVLRSGDQSSMNESTSSKQVSFDLSPTVVTIKRSKSRKRRSVSTPPLSLSKISEESSHESNSNSLDDKNELEWIQVDRIQQSKLQIEKSLVLTPHSTKTFNEMKRERFHNIESNSNRRRNSSMKVQSSNQSLEIPTVTQLLSSEDNSPVPFINDSSCNDPEQANIKPSLRSKKSYYVKSDIMESLIEKTSPKSLGNNPMGFLRTPNTKQRSLTPSLTNHDVHRVVTSDSPWIFTTPSQSSDTTQSQNETNNLMKRPKINRNRSIPNISPTASPHHRQGKRFISPNESNTMDSPPIRKPVLHKKMSSTLPNFMIEMIDPQINFLDVTSHSSLIIVAGRSYVEGSKGINAVIHTNHEQPTMTGKDNESNKDTTLSNHQQTAQRKHEIKLRMDGVSAFTIPTFSPSSEISSESFTLQSSTGNDGNDIVHWKVMDNTITTVPTYTNDTISSKLKRHPSLRMKRHTPLLESSLLKVAIKDFKIRAQYTFWVDVKTSEAKSMTVFLCRDEAICSFLLDLPEIIVDTDSTQFYIILNVIRNVLLVPPPPLSKRLQSDKEDSMSNKFMELTKDEKLLEKHGLKLGKDTTLDLTKQHTREALKILIEDALMKPQQIEFGMARVNQVFIGKAVWLLRPHSSGNTTVNPISIIETVFIGVYATVTFHEDRSSSLLLEIQRLWARSLPWDYNNQSETQSTSDSITNRGQNNNLNETIWVMKPEVYRTEICDRCGQTFTAETNQVNSCVFHADETGLPGEYKEITIYDSLLRCDINVEMWTCCGRTQKDAPGCSNRPHVCKEIMAQIRAEAHQSSKIDHIEMQVLHTLEISFFPGALYQLQIHVTKNLVEMLHNYFSIDSNINLEQMINEKESSSDHITSPGVVTSTSSPNHSSGSKMNGTSTESNMNRSRSNTDTNDTSNQSTTKPKTITNRLSLTKGWFHTEPKKDSNKDDHHDNGNKPKTETSNQDRPGRRTSLSGANITELVKSHGMKTIQRQEGVYINYMRVGDINVDVSTAGYAINIDNYRAVVEPFICRGEVLESWHKLIGKLEYHAVLSVTKHFAANAYNRLGTILFGNGTGNNNNPRQISAVNPSFSLPDSTPMNPDTSIMTIDNPMNHDNNEGTDRSHSQTTQETSEVANYKKSLLLGKKKSNKSIFKYISS